MIYTSKDIVKKAELAADLQNSDFISWYEKMTLLNDAYAGLYQKLVNIGDMSFVKRINVSNVQALPCDFYQLKNLYLKSGRGLIQVIPRRSPSSSFNTLSYEIIENTLYVYGATMGEVVMEYFKKPCDLILAPEKEEMNASSGLDFYGGYQNLFLVDDNSDNLAIYNVDKTSFIATDIAPDSIEPCVWDNQHPKIVFGKEGFAYKKAFKSEWEDRYSVRFWNGKESFSSSVPKGDKSCLVEIDGDVGVLRVSSEHLFTSIDFLSKVGTNIEVPRKIAEDFASNLKGGFEILTYDKVTKTWFAITNESRRIYKYTEGDDEHDFIEGRQQDFSGVLSMKVDNGILWFVDSSNIYKINITDYINGSKDVKSYPLLGSKYAIITDFDYNTGFGFVEKSIDLNFYRLTFLEDTILDFPTNFYYQLLSIMLAIQFKIKQGADITLLAQQLVAYENTFYDTLTNDANDFTRIKNIY